MNNLKTIIFIFILLLASLGLFIGNSRTKAITPQDINAKECKKYVDSLFDEFADLARSKYFSREGAIATCSDEMDNNYKNGLPSYATHTPHDVESYREEKRKKSAMDFRSRHAEDLDRIKESCARPIFDMYLGMYGKKTAGESKEDQVKVMRTMPHDPQVDTILDGILVDLSYKALDDIYAESGPATHAEVADRIVVFYEKCTEMYESALFLR